MANNSKAKKMADEALGSISAAISILDKIPNISTDKLSLSVDVNPINFIMNVLYKTVGYDKVIEFVANCLTTSIDAIELAVKNAILIHLKDLFTCTINPFISYDLIQEGVVFSLKNIDLINMLYYSPLDNTVSRTKRNGRYYYFGCEEFEFPDELESAKDFNAVLWYMKNRTTDSRVVWYGYNKQASSINRPSLNERQKKNDGIITLEYSEKSSDITNAEGQRMWLQTPYDNCIHVFLGNTKPLSNDYTETLNSKLISTNEQLSKFTNLREKLFEENNKLKEKLEGNLYALEPDAVFQKAMLETYMEYNSMILNAIDNSTPICDVTDHMLQMNVLRYDPISETYIMELPTGDSINIDVNTYNNTNEALIAEKNSLYDELSLYEGNAYRDPKLNYYYHKTLLQFNSDYIFSVKLFDSKSLAARLLDALSGCLTVGVDLSIEERIIQNEVDRMIHDIIDSDDTVVNDCFFSFTNDEYNELIERSELQRLGLYVSPDGAVGGEIDAESVMAALNELAPNATHEEIKSAIEKSVFELTKIITPEYDGEKEYGLNGNLQANLIENLLQSLANVIVMSAITPKVYLLMAINLKILGREPNFDLATFIDNFRKLIVAIVRSIKDSIMQLLKDWVLEIVGDLAKQIGVQLALEQFEYYTTLLRKCIECFKVKRNLIGWNMADVGADIYDMVNNEETSEEC